MKGSLYKRRAEGFGFSWNERHRSEEVKCLRVCKNLSQGRMEQAILYILWMYRKRINGVLTAALNAVRLLSTSE